MACALYLSTLLLCSKGVLEHPKSAAVQHLVAFEQLRRHRAVACLRLHLRLRLRLRLRLHTFAGRCRFCRTCAHLADLVLESKEAKLERVRLRHRSCRLIHKRPTRGDPRGIGGLPQGGEKRGRRRARHGARRLGDGAEALEWRCLGAVSSRSCCGDGASLREHCQDGARVRGGGQVAELFAICLSDHHCTK